MEGDGDGSPGKGLQPNGRRTKASRRATCELGTLLRRRRRHPQRSLTDVARSTCSVALARDLPVQPAAARNGRGDARPSRAERRRLEERGLSPADARSAARRDFGNATVLAFEAREARGARWSESFVTDLRLALRGLRRTPLFALVAVLSIGIGVGATTGIVSIANAVLLRPPVGIASPDRMVTIASTRNGHGFNTISYPTFLDYSRATSLTALAAVSLEPNALSILTPQGSEGSTERHRLRELLRRARRRRRSRSALRAWRRHEIQPRSRGRVERCVLAQALQWRSGDRWADHHAERGAVHRRRGRIAGLSGTVRDRSGLVDADARARFGCRPRKGS